MFERAKPEEFDPNKQPEYKDGEFHPDVVYDYEPGREGIKFYNPDEVGFRKPLLRLAQLNKKGEQALDALEEIKKILEKLDDE